MSAIRSTLELVRAKLDASFKASDPRAEDWVVLSNVVDHQGAPFEAAKGKLVVFLAGIQHETTISTHNRAQPLGDSRDQFAVVRPPLYVNLLLLFFANFYDQSYAVGLDMIAHTISFFQQTPFFTHDTLPDLDPSIEKLTFEMMNLDLLQVNYLLSMMGVKYLPAVLYRVRTIPFRGDAFTGIVPPTRDLSTSGAPKARDTGA